MHFRKKDCEFFCKFFYYIIKGDFQKFEKLKSDTPHVEKT